MAGTQFSPACDANDPGVITLLITALATGPQEKTQTFAQLLPEGQQVKVTSTKTKKIYFASQQMNVFDKKGEFQVNGKVTDLANNLITEPNSPMTVILDQTFGKECFRTITVPVTNGFWEAKLWKFND